MSTKSSHHNHHFNKYYVNSSNLIYEQIDVHLTISSCTGVTSFSSSNSSSHHHHASSSSTATYMSSLGCAIAGYCPCYIESVDEESSARVSGLRRGDLLVKVNGVNCCRATLKTVLSLLKHAAADSRLTLTVQRSKKPQQQQQQQHVPAHRNRRLILLNTSLNSKKRHQVEVKRTRESGSLPRRVLAAKKTTLLAKLFRPSLWLSCGQQSSAANATFCYVKQEVGRPFYYFLELAFTS